MVDGSVRRYLTREAMEMLRTMVNESDQVVTDLPSSTDFSAAQNHLNQGAIRQMHWHSFVSKLACIL